MVTYNQQHQHVGTQYNAGRDIYLIPRPGTLVGRPLHEVFVSSGQDVDTYRVRVTQTLAKIDVTAPDAGLVIHLPTAEHRARVWSSDGYMALVGHCYGQVIPAYQKSLLHQEFEWAAQHWTAGKNRRLMVFRPELNSPADAALRQKAAILIGPNLQENETRLQTFLTGLNTGPEGWRHVKYFRDESDLKEHVQITCNMWLKSIMSFTAPDALPPEPARIVTGAELGRLGRTEQAGLVKKILAYAAAKADVPAVALLVHGPPGAGQVEFLRYLVTLPTLRQGRPPEKGWGALPLHQVSLPQLVEWISTMLGLPAGEAIATPAKLAGLVHTALKQGQLCLVLDQVERLAGGVATFQEQFWQPFYAELKRLCGSQPPPHRLILLVVDHTGQAAAWQGLTCSGQAKVSGLDFARLLELPVLGPFEEDHYYDWLADLEIPAGLHQNLVAGLGPLATPAAVFEYLRHQTLWPEGEIE